MASTDTDITKVSILGRESIHCGFHLAPYIVDTLLGRLPSSTYVLVTDTNIAGAHLTHFEKEFDRALKAIDNGSKTPPRFFSHVIAPGETSKSREGKADVEDFLLANACTRDTVLIALGGGVIGDLVGFVAATFMRGLRYVQVPTSLLAMVDSSVGGKTAIDTPHGKNLIGAFWQPEFIFIDASFLETLPPREFSNGMAEVVKTAAIWDESEFSKLESRSSEIVSAIQTPSSNYSGRSLQSRSQAQSLLLSVIVASISVKAFIVTKDERETGLRNLVNFGHTIGHASEAVLTPTVLHGECVSVGIILEAEVARTLGVLTQVSVGRLARALSAYNLPISLSDPRIASLPQVGAGGLRVERLLDIMRIDKKNSGPEKKVVLLSRIGKTHEERASVVPDAVIAKTLADAVCVVPSPRPAKEHVKMSTPGSKSMSNRALVLAALAKGTCKLKNLLHSDDTQVMMGALQDLKGAKFTWEDGGETLVVEGGQGALSVPDEGKEIYLGNAGTAARFLTSVCALVSDPSPNNSSEKRTVITGNKRMKQRPIGPLVNALRENGSTIEYLESEGCLPLAIAPKGLKGGTIRLAASVSSQYVSSVLLCAPLAQGEEGVTLELTGGQVVSQPYIDMTIAMMKSFGVTVTRRRDPSTNELLDIYDVPRSAYQAPEEYKVESDASSATYPLAIAAITGGKCTIENIGRGSVQGDAQFAVEVLGRMGCVVEQGGHSTTVIGPKPGGLKAIEGEIDMESMTDAFLTASVLAAVAPGRKTRIRGIANQRVKECNRIRAMMDELAKFGIETNELDDGLEIVGRPLEELKRGVSVHCYDDHRVAMAFSVLGTVVSGTVIEEKRCVEKTWPSWWDDLENKIGFKVEGVELASDLHRASASASRNASEKDKDSPASVIIIGMRGSGKTFIGTVASDALHWPFIDADTHFEKKHETGVRQFVADHGWPAFREEETQILRELVRDNPTRHIISLGGGIVETPAARELLVEYKRKGGPVVHMVRSFDEVLAYLGSESARPAYGEEIADVYRRREPWFGECSSHVFVNHVGKHAGEVIGEMGLRKGTRDEIERFFGHVVGHDHQVDGGIGVEGGRTCFLSLTYGDVSDAIGELEELSSGADALELRVDLLRAPGDDMNDKDYVPPLEYVADQVAAIRRSSHLPIVYTVRSVAQGGAFPDARPDKVAELLDLAVRLAVEYIDVEISLVQSCKAAREVLGRRGRSQIIASHHDWSGDMKWTGPQVAVTYAAAAGFGDMVKIIGKARCLQDNLDLQAFVGRVKSGKVAPGPKPVIAVNMGTEGQLSRILNEVFTPVTHPRLPVRAAPGQLSFAQIQQALNLMGQLPARKFFLFGTPIAHSLSPTLHNTAFEALGLPHRYALFETDKVDERIKKVIDDPEFGGASVTVPFKLDVIPLLHQLSPAARAMGAVNTIIPRVSASKRILYGDNTDWIGLRQSIRLSIPSGIVPSALVIGAGGAARGAIYALQSLGVPIIYLYNRTRATAVSVKDAFAHTGIRVLDSLDKWPEDVILPNVVISTVPANVTALASDSDSARRMVLPVQMFDYKEGPAVVIDMAYKPVQTPLLRLAKESASKSWTTISGVQILLLQGYEQFELWTGKRCPRGITSKAVWEKYNQSA